MFSMKTLQVHLIIELTLTLDSNLKNSVFDLEAGNSFLNLSNSELYWETSPVSFHSSVIFDNAKKVQ